MEEKQKEQKHSEHAHHEHEHIERHHEHHEHEHHEKHIHKKSPAYLSLGNIFIYIAILLGILVIINIVLTFSLNKELKKSIEETKEKLRPANIELMIVKNSKCTDCSDVSAMVSYIKGQNVKVTKESTVDFDSSEGKGLVSKYGIQKVPAVIVTGEAEKSALQGMEKKADALVLSDVAPPYTETSTGKIKGRVTLYLLKDALCEKCNDLSLFLSQVKSAGLKISQEKSIDAGSEEGKDLIKRYNIGFAPSVILSKDAELYNLMQQSWPQVGTKESDGSYVLRSATPPFINLTTGKIRGVVNMIYLADKSCTECYDVSLHKQIIASPQSFAIKLDKEETVDISDGNGKELLAKYNITQVPTVIISEEVSAYPTSQALKQFFSVEKDGYYVFRRLSVLGAYKDLSTNSVVKPQQNQDQHE